MRLSLPYLRSTTEIGGKSGGGVVICLLLVYFCDSTIAQVGMILPASASVPTTSETMYHFVCVLLWLDSRDHVLGWGGVSLYQTTKRNRMDSVIRYIFGWIHP